MGKARLLTKPELLAAGGDNAGALASPYAHEW